MRRKMTFSLPKLLHHICTKEGPDNSATLPILYHLNLSNDYKRVKVTLYMGLKKCKNGKMIKYCKKVPLKLQSTGRKPAI